MLYTYWKNGSVTYTQEDIEKYWESDQKSYYLSNPRSVSYDNITASNLMNKASEKGKIMNYPLPKLQWKIIDLFNSIPNSSGLNQADFKKLPRYDYLGDTETRLVDWYFK